MVELLLLIAGMTDTSTLSVRVVGPDGRPVEDAEVWVTQLAAGDTYLELPRGPETVRRTDAKGRCRFEAVTELPYDQVTTRACFRGTHPDFATWEGRCASANENGVFEDEFLMRLEAGHTVEVAAAVLDADVPEDRLFLIVRDSITDTKRTVRSAGSLSTPPISAQQNAVLPAAVPEDGPPLFGDLIRWDADDPSTLRAATALQAGVRVTGRLDDAVARPVRHGQVSARCVFPVPPHKEIPYRIQSGFSAWVETVDVRRDGTFTFPSLPYGCDLYLTAIGDGFVSAVPDRAAREAAVARYGGSPLLTRGWRQPQIWFEIDEDTSPVLKAEPSGGAAVTVTGADGRPAAGVRVGVGISLSSPGVGSTSGGWRYDTRARLAKERRGADPTPYVRRVTDNEGRVVFADLPPGERHLYFLHPEINLQLPVDNAGEYGRFPFTVKPSEETPVDVRLKPR